MSHKPAPYSPNFPQSQNKSDAGDPNESYSMQHQSGYPGPPQYGPGAQPLLPMQPGYQPGFQPGLQPGYQPGFQPGFSPGYQQPQPGYPHVQGGYQPGYAPGAPIVHQPGMQPQGPPGK